jgi:hypothetical protein
MIMIRTELSRPVLVRWPCRPPAGGKISILLYGRPLILDLSRCRAHCKPGLNQTCLNVHYLNEHYLNEHYLNEHYINEHYINEHHINCCIR